MRICLVALLVAACGTPPPATRPTSSPATLTLALVAPNAPRGRVAWAWLPQDAFEGFSRGQPEDAHFVTLLESLRTTDPVELGDAPIEVGAFDAPGAGGFLVILQPPDGDFLSAVTGHPVNGGRFALSELVRPPSPDPMMITVQLDAPPERPASPERCAGDGRELITLEVPEVAGLVGNDPMRRLCVALPASYGASSVRRYPVVFLMHGYGGNDTTYMSLADEGHELILVGVDGRAAFGTSYFHRTDMGGDWEVLLERAVAEVDRRFRTVADPSHRALLGHSTGGYNAISLALRRTDLFTAAAASSPDGLDFGAWLFDDDAQVRSPYLAWTRLEVTLGDSGQMISYAAQLDDASRPDALAWPFDLATGARDDEVWARWEQNTPAGLLEDGSVRTRAQRHLGGRLYLSVGRNDAFGLFPPAERFHERLDELEIEHTWVPTAESHFEGSDRRRAAGLAFLANVL